jgi:hypothetical protein
MSAGRKSLIILIALLCLGPLLIPAEASPGARAVSAQDAEAYLALLAASGNQVFAFNDLGMHCYDSDFSVFSILPLFNVVHAQVIRKGSLPVILGDADVSLFYQAVRDAKGSINTTSRGKTNFWTYAQALFALPSPLPVDAGLLGAKMPGAANARRPFLKYDSTMKWFAAEGIPITGIDNLKKTNTYALMNIRALRKGGTEVSRLSVVVPASQEMNCGSCHLTGMSAASNPTVQWSSDPNQDHQLRKNILLVHDLNEGTTLFQSQPVLCASCHYSRPLDLGGLGPQNSLAYMSRAMHGFHSDKMGQVDLGSTACYNCHPGSKTQCLRGAMFQAGMGCTDCHGNMIAVAKDSREPWLGEPKCQSCHTGDALSHLGATVILKTAYDGTDPSNAIPRVAINKRFAEQTDTSLYRMSLGHGGMACEACHGSPHAEWPTPQANDNVAAIKIQGRKGTISDCTACHGSGLANTIDGPHGMHNVAKAGWYDGGHEDFYQSNPDNCRACHGVDLLGTLLSRVPVTRKFVIEGRTITVLAGMAIRCNLCHGMPGI